MIPFNYHHLHYFHTVAREKTLSSAAKTLRISQPALSAQLRQFEDFLGLNLFERRGKKLVLTEDGKHVLSYAEIIVNAGRELKDGLEDRSQKGRLRIQIGIADSIPKNFAATFAAEILKLEPDVHLTVHEYKMEDMLEDLKLHALDVILSDIPAKVSSEEGIQNFLLGRVPVVFCAHPSVAKKYRKLPRDLNGAPVILPTAHSQVFHQVQEYFATHRINPHIVAEIHDVELVSRLVSARAGIAPLNEWMLKSGPRLAVLPARPKPKLWDSFYLIIKKRTRPHPLTERILKLDFLARR